MWKPKKKGEWEINKKSVRKNQGEINKESLRLWERKTSGTKIKGKERSCEGTNEERLRKEGQVLRYAWWEKIVGKERGVGKIKSKKWLTHMAFPLSFIFFK